MRLSSASLRSALPSVCAWAIIFLVGMYLEAKFHLPKGAGVADIPQSFQDFIHLVGRLREGADPYVAPQGLSFLPSPGLLVVGDWMPGGSGSAEAIMTAWRFFLSFNLSCLGAALFFGFRYRTWKSVLFLLLGLVAAWNGILETLARGQLELIALGVAVLSAAVFPRFAVMAGLGIGILPALKLHWTILFFPFVWRSLSFSKQKPEGLKRERNFRQFFSGYALGWFIWAAALPSLRLGSDRAKVISQAWVQLLKSQPEILDLSNLNQSLTSTLLRFWGTGAIFWVFAVVLVFAGWRLGVRLSQSRSAPGQTYPLAWLSPWFILMQLINPLGWRWGSVYALGIPLSAYFSYRSDRPYGKWVLSLLAVALWVAQQNPAWNAAHPDLITAYWLVLIFLA